MVAPVRAADVGYVGASDNRRGARQAGAALDEIILLDDDLVVERLHRQAARAGEFRRACNGGVIARSLCGRLVHAQDDAPCRVAGEGVPEMRAIDRGLSGRGVRAAAVLHGGVERRDDHRVAHVAIDVLVGDAFRGVQRGDRARPGRRHVHALELAVGIVAAVDDQIRRIVGAAAGKYRATAAALAHLDVRGREQVHDAAVGMHVADRALQPEGDVARSNGIARILDVQAVQGACRVGAADVAVAVIEPVNGDVLAGVQVHPDVLDIAVVERQVLA